ncbi:hypothetical protein O162_24155 [Pseudomonas putida SJ3]|nr:hypothetical protein O162_24155 [Pseudomonas putida SJ3]PNB55879.1 hypothetical protein C1X73_20750 [Pseudomonas sp. FW305-130]
MMGLPWGGFSIMQQSVRWPGLHSGAKMSAQDTFMSPLDCGVSSHTRAPWAKASKPVESRFLFARRLERWQPAAMTESVPEHMNAHVK